MNSKNIIFILFMLINSTFTLLFYNFYNYDILFSISIVLNIIISFYVLLKNSPEDYVLKLSLVYLMGFTLFIGGRFVANLFGAEDIYCFEFGYTYCLNTNEKLKLNFLLNSSLVFFVLGFIFRSKEEGNVIKKKEEFINKSALTIILIASVFLGLLSIYYQFESVVDAIKGGYGVLYEGQGKSEEYQTPVTLLISTIFLATVAIAYSVNNKIKPYIFYILVSMYIFSQLMSVLTGARAGFITAIVILLWIFLGRGKFGLKKFAIIISAIFIISVTNYVSSLTGARINDTGNSLYESIVLEIFYGQGISMMVFSIGTMEVSYPVVAYLKTIFPGIQVIYQSIFNVEPYDLSFSTSLTHKLAPSVYYDNMGWGWTLLGDFYAFSFGITAIFLFYNFFWGKLLYKISALNGTNTYFRGLFFCFIISVFNINRASISYLIFLIFLYTALYFSLKLVIRKKY